MPSFCVSTVLTPDQRDIATATWYTLGMQGCEEEMVQDGVRVKVYFKDFESAKLADSDLKNYAPKTPILLYEVEDQDWNKKWRESMEPAKLAPGFWVSPTWCLPRCSQMMCG
jgi:ribosomal protein L11 methylase PrmA